MVTDPIADMLTRIRNANQMRDKEVEVPASNLKIEIAKILKEEGFVNDYKIKKNNVQNIIVLNLKYTDNKVRVITGLKKISKPGIISTSKGVMTDKKARELSLGGEVLAYVW